jgi:hypothetical protein
VVNFEMRALAPELAPDKISKALRDQEGLERLTRLSLVLAEPREKKGLPQLSFAGVAGEN